MCAYCMRRYARLSFESRQGDRRGPGSRPGREERAAERCVVHTEYDCSFQGRPGSLVSSADQERIKRVCWLQSDVVSFGSDCRVQLSLSETGELHWLQCRVDTERGSTDSLTIDMRACRHYQRQQQVGPLIHQTTARIEAKRRGGEF
jgi:hypothetical protein